MTSNVWLKQVSEYLIKFKYSKIINRNGMMINFDGIQINMEGLMYFIFQVNKSGFQILFYIISKRILRIKKKKTSIFGILVLMEIMK
jgi:hypothetical protein